MKNLKLAIPLFALLALAVLLSGCPSGKMMGSAPQTPPSVEAVA